MKVIHVLSVIHGFISHSIAKFNNKLRISSFSIINISFNSIACSASDKWYLSYKNLFTKIRHIDPIDLKFVKFSDSHFNFFKTLIIDYDFNWIVCRILISCRFSIGCFSRSCDWNSVDIETSDIRKSTIKNTPNFIFLESFFVCV